MNVPFIFMAVIICLLVLYMMNRFIQRPGIVTTLILIIQFLTATVTIFSLFENVFTTPLVELIMLLAGVFLPVLVVVYDHVDFSRRRKKSGAEVSFIEKKERRKQSKWDVSFFTGNAEVWRKEINALDVYRTLSIKDEMIKENVKKQLNLIQRLINLERYETAAEQYRFLSVIFPDCAEIAYNTGYLYCFIGKFKEAYKILIRAQRAMNKQKCETIKAKDGVTADNYNDLGAAIQFYTGYALYHLGKYAHSIRHFQKVLETNPDLTVAYKNIAKAFLVLGVDNKAIDYLEKGRMDLRDSSMRIVLGSLYYRMGNTKKAVEVLDEVAQADTKRVEALKWKGKAAIREKMYDKAIECFSALIQIDLSDPFHFYHLALAQRASKQKEKALKTYDLGISEHPQNSMLLYNAATLMDELGHKERAVQTLYKSLEGDEYLEDAVNYLGVLLGQMGRYRESIQVFEKGIKRFDNSGTLYFNLGIVLEMARRLNDAAEAFEMAYHLNPKDPILIYHFTAVLLKIRDYGKAIRICKQGLSDYPDDAELVYGLSKIYSHMGEKDIAVDLLRKAVELDPLYLSRLKKDIEFAALKNHPGYQALMVS